MRNTKREIQSALRIQEKEVVPFTETRGDNKKNQTYRAATGSTFRS